MGGCSIRGGSIPPVRMSDPWIHHCATRYWMKSAVRRSAPNHATRLSVQSSAEVLDARARRRSAARPHSRATERTPVSARRRTDHSLNPSSVTSSPSTVLANSSISVAVSPPRSAAAATSEAARWARTSRTRHPSHALSLSQAWGSVYCTVRPSPSRSARATPRSHILSRVIGRRFYRLGWATPRTVRSVAMRVLIAPDKFKGTLAAVDVAGALAGGWRRGDPAADVEAVPVADGGDGTLQALVAGLGGETHRATVTGPLGEPVDATYGLVN